MARPVPLAILVVVLCLAVASFSAFHANWQPSAVHLSAGLDLKADGGRESNTKSTAPEAKSKVNASPEPVKHSKPGKPVSEPAPKPSPTWFDKYGGAVVMLSILSFWITVSGCFVYHAVWAYPAEIDRQYEEKCAAERFKRAMIKSHLNRQAKESLGGQVTAERSQLKPMIILDTN